MPSVVRVCRARTRNADDAADAVQETVIQFLRADRTRIDNPHGWLLTVAVRTCAAIHRRRARRAETELADTVDAGAAVDPAAEAAAAVSVRELGRRLSVNDRRLVQWLYVEGRSIDDVARELGVSRGNVRIMSFRARHRARLVLESMDSPIPDSDRKSA